MFHETHRYRGLKSLNALDRFAQITWHSLPCRKVCAVRCRAEASVSTIKRKAMQRIWWSVSVSVMTTERTYAERTKITAALWVYSAGLQEGLALWFSAGHSEGHGGKSHDKNNGRFEELHGWVCVRTVVRSMRLRKYWSSWPTFYTFSGL